MNSVTIALVGQALIRRPIADGIQQPGVDHVAAILQSADVAFTNFEAAIMPDSHRWPTKDFRDPGVSPTMLDQLMTMGFNVMSLANNHAFDMGPGGILATIGAAEERGLLHAGTGRTAKEASAPRAASIAGIGVALASFVATSAPDNSHALDSLPDRPSRPGVARLPLIESEGKRIPDPLHTEGLLASLQEAAARSDHTIAYLHHHDGHGDQATWPSPPSWVREFGRRCIEAGAAVFVSHGIPILQGVEIYRERPIFYNLGNFIFHSRRPEHWWRLHEVFKSVVALCTFSREGVLLGLEAYPIALGGSAGLASDDILAREAPHLVAGALATSILEGFAGSSRTLGTVLDIRDGRASARIS